MATETKPDASPGLAAPAATLLLAAWALSGCSPAGSQPAKGPRDDAIPVTTASVALAPVDRTLVVVGTLLPRNEAVIAAQVEGQLQQTLVDFGDRVQSGQELGFIDTDSYQALARQAAANLARAQASLQNAENNLKRVKALQQDRISSASDLDAATAQAEQARAEVKAAEAAEAIAQLNLARSRVRAPFPAAVAERIASAGDYVKTGTALFRLVEDRELKFLVQAPERYAGQVKTGQVAQFSVDAWPGQLFQGQVFLVSPSVSTATRSFNLAALVPNADGKLKANTFARGELLLERAVPTPVLPLDAVLNFAGVTKVFVVETNRAHSRAVKLGRVLSGGQEILEGLKPGEVVATTGLTKLYENAPVRLAAAAPAAEKAP